LYLIYSKFPQHQNTSKMKLTSFQRYNSIFHIVLKQWNERNCPTRSNFAKCMETVFQLQIWSWSQNWQGLGAWGNCSPSFWHDRRRKSAKHEEISQKNHDFDIPTPNTALMVILTVNGSVGDQVGDSPMVPTAKHSLFALKPAHIAWNPKFGYFITPLLRFFVFFLSKQMQRALVTCPEVTGGIQ